MHSMNWKMLKMMQYNRYSRWQTARKGKIQTKESILLCTAPSFDTAGNISEWMAWRLTICFKYTFSHQFVEFELTSDCNKFSENFICNKHAQPTLEWSPFVVVRATGEKTQRMVKQCHTFDSMAARQEIFHFCFGFRFLFGNRISLRATVIKWTNEVKEWNVCAVEVFLVKIVQCTS